MNDSETDPEFERIVSAVEVLESVALEHENKQTGPHKDYCLENRCFIIAMAMRRLELGVSEIGIVAEHLFEIECEHAAADEALAADSSDKILDESDINIE